MDLTKQKLTILLKLTTIKSLKSHLKRRSE